MENFALASAAGKCVKFEMKWEEIPSGHLVAADYEDYCDLLNLILYFLPIPRQMPLGLNNGEVCFHIVQLRLTATRCNFKCKTSKGHKRHGTVIKMPVLWTNYVSCTRCYYL